MTTGRIAGPDSSFVFSPLNGDHMNAFHRIFNRLSCIVSIVGFALSCVAFDASAQTRAALVRDTDNPTLQPFTILKSAGFDSTGSATLNFGQVPAGKRLVVQNVSYYVGLTSAVLLDGYLYVPNQLNSTRLYFSVPTPTPYGSINYYSISFPTTVYFEAGEFIFGIIGTTGRPNNDQIYVVLTGYYITP